MLKYFIKSKGILVAYLIMVPAMALTSVAFTKAMQPVVDVTQGQDTEAFLKSVGIFVLFVALDMLATYFHKISREKLRREFLVHVKKDFFQGLLKMDIATFQKKPTASYVSMMQRDIGEINVDYFDSVCGIYRVVVCFLITFVALVQMNPWVAILNIVVALLTLLLPQLLEKRLVQAQDIASEEAEKYQGKLSDALAGFHTIKLFSVSQRIEALVENQNQSHMTAEYKSVKLNYNVSWICMLCTQVGYVGTIVLAAYFVLIGELTVGGILAISQLIGGILAPFEELPGFLTSLKSVKGIKEKVLTIINTAESKTVEVEGEVSTEIAVDDVSFSYEDKKVLQNISLNFQSGKKYALLGASGSGKSTLAKMLLDIYPTDEGTIKFGDTPIGELSRSQLYHTVNYMQQEVFLFDDTIKNNITLYQDYPKEDIEKAIIDAGLRSYIEELESGLDTVISGNGNNLSGGQKQRIGLARTLLSGAKVIIFDEVTSALDAMTAKKVEETILRLPDITVIMITHRLNEDTLSKFDEIVVLDRGVVEEQGNFQELMDKKGLLYSFQRIFQGCE